MARFFGQGPLIFLLCMALCDGDSVGNDTETTETVLSQTIQTSSPSLTPLHQHNTTTEVTSPSPARTPSLTSQLEDEGPAEPQCTFTAAMTTNGAEVKIFNGSANATYTVMINETTNNVITIKEDVKENVTIPFHQLKLCTNYTVEVKNCSDSIYVTFNTPNDDTSVSHSVKSLNDGQVCYKDGKWNLTKCVTINEKACKTLPLNETLDTCNFTIMAMLPPDKPNINYTETIPTQFMWRNKPQHCDDTQMKVKCTGGSWNRTFALNESVLFLPNKTYICTGEYPFEKNTSKSKEIPVDITCDWQKNKLSLFKNITSTSFVMSWRSQNDENCPGIELYYDASCNNIHHSVERKSCTQNKNKTSGTDCTFQDLKPNEIYTCKISARVDTSITSDQSDTGHYILSTGKIQTDPSAALPVTHVFNVCLKPT